MPANVALTAGELTDLNATEHLVSAALSYIPDDAVGTATVDAGFVASYPLPQIAVTGASAGWTDGVADQTMKITNADGTVLRGYYRIRSAPTSSLVLIEEISGEAEGGVIAWHNRTAEIAPGDLCTILYRRDLCSRKPSTVAGTVYQDYGYAVGVNNATPEVIVNVAINGEPGDFVAEVAQGGTQAISAVVTVTKWATSSGSTLTYLWTYPASFTGVSGATTDTLVATAPVGSHFIRCTVTDSIGGATDIERWIRIHDPSDPPLEIKIPAEDNRTRQYRTMTIYAKQSTISVIPPGAYCVIRGAATWGGDDVPTAAKKFGGYLVAQPFGQEPGYHESSATLVGPMGIVALLDGYAHLFDYTGTTTTWQNLHSSLSTIQFMIWWMLKWRVSNILRRHNFTPLTTGNLSGRRSKVSIAPAKVSEQLKTLADAVDANIGSRSDGEVIVRSHPSLLEDRSQVVTRATLTNSIYSNIQVEWKRRVNHQPIKLGGYASTLTGAGDSRLASAAPFDHTNAQMLDERVFESQTDADQRSGRYYARANSQYGQVMIDIPTHWDVFEPADMQRVSVQVPADKSPTGAAITLTCIPEQVVKTWLGGRRAAIQLIGEVETDGLPGVALTMPAQAAEDDIYLSPPPLPTPTADDTADLDGSEIVAFTAAAIGFTTGTGAAWSPVDTPGGTIYDLMLDPRSPLLGGSGKLAVWCVTSTGLYYTADLLASTVLWSLKNSLSPGVSGAILRPWASAPGVVYIAWNNGTSPVYTARLSAYGATTDWTHTLGSANHSGSDYGMDIDSYGADEMLVSYRDSGTGSHVARILNGATPVVLVTLPFANNEITFLQKPLLTFAGAVNSNTGSSENFIFINANAGSGQLRKTTNGGGVTTIITPSPFAYPNNSVSSYAFTSDANVLAVIDNTGRLYTSDDGGTTWTDRGQNSNRQSLTTGFFPRLIAGNYALYTGGTSQMGRSGDFGATFTDITGDWGSAVGAASNFLGVIPLS